MADNLAKGRFGAADAISDAASALYVAAGAPGAATRFGVHPSLDNHVWSALRWGVSPSLAPNALLAEVQGAADGARRWFDRSHPADCALTEKLESELSDELHDDVQLGAPSPGFIDSILEADALLESTLPDIWRSTRPFVTRVYDMGTERSNSATFDSIGGAVLLSSPSLNQNTDRREQVVSLAECLLHEAAHSKSYRLFRSFDRVTVLESPEFIDVPWWRTEGGTWNWDIDRSIVAAHVYTHLAVLYDALAAEDVTFRGRRDRTTFRARFLSNVLQQLDNHWLDDQWRAFVVWFSASIPALPRISQAGTDELERDIRTFPKYSALLAARLSSSR